MGTGTRIFIINDDDSIKRIPWTKFERLKRRDPKLPFPQYAGKRVRYAFIFLETENRKPIGFKLVQYGYLPFDKDGLIDAAEKEEAARLGIEMVASLEDNRLSSSVINAQHRFLKKRYHDRYRWKPTAELEAMIMEAALGFKAF